MNIEEYTNEVCKHIFHPDIADAFTDEAIMYCYEQQMTAEEAVNHILDSYIGK